MSFSLGGFPFTEQKRNKEREDVLAPTSPDSQPSSRMEQETHLDVEKVLGITTLSLETEHRKDEEKVFGLEGACPAPTVSTALMASVRNGEA